jgi:hypothetical protein
MTVKAAMFIPNQKNFFIMIKQQGFNFNNNFITMGNKFCLQIANILAIRF